MGNLFTVSAPSGAGKTSLVNALIAADADLVLSVSHTTRPQRAGEVDGRDYHFLPELAFLEKVSNAEFLEHAQVFGNYYGTDQVQVETRLAAGLDVILEIDWQGVQQIKRLKPQTVSLFILPPSRQALEERLRKRAQDSEAVITKRMAEVRQEISHYVECDYLIINDDFDAALKNMQAVITAQRQSLSVQQKRYARLLSELLK